MITANESNSLEKYEISKLNVSICSMHSLIQETANFLPLGVNILILVIPLFITAVLSVWVYKFVTGANRKLYHILIVVWLPEKHFLAAR